MKAYNYAVTQLSALDLTEHQKEVVTQAQQAFVLGLDAGVEEDVLLDALFDAANRWLKGSLETQIKKQAESCREKCWST